MLINAGLLKAAGVLQDLLQVKDFASNLLALKLTLIRIVRLVLPVNCANYKAARALATTLFFVCAHLLQ